MNKSGNMSDNSLRCNEILSPDRLSSTPVAGGRQQQGERLGSQRSLFNAFPQFCKAAKDKAILNSKVFFNLKRLEKYYLSKLDHYQNVQKEIKVHMRKTVTEWMLDVCLDQRCNIDVFLLATNIMDRFVQTIQLQKNQFQLCGACAIFLASKLTEASPVSALTLIKCTADTYDLNEFMTMEFLILTKLKWDLTAVTSYDFIHHLVEELINPSRNSQRINSPAQLLKPSCADEIRLLTEKLITLCATECFFVELPPSLITAASMVVAVKQDSANLLHPEANLNQVVERFADILPSDLGNLQQTVGRIEQIFLGIQESLTTTTTSLPDEFNDSGIPGESSSSFNDDQFNTSSSYENDNNTQHQSESKSSNLKSKSDPSCVEISESDRETDNATPKEVFSVLASCVT